MTTTLKRRGSATLVAMVCALTWLACGGVEGETEGRSGGDQSPTYPRFAGARAFELVKRQVAFGPRVPGTAGHRAMARWLEEYLGQRGDTLILQRFTHITQAGDTLPLINFFARFRPGEGRPILLLAHWDTRPISDQASDPADREKPVPGANDGASGTAVLLELADMMAESEPPRPVDLLLVDGEDYGDFGLDLDVFLGSRYFVRHMPADYDPEFAVLLDMVGDRDLQIYVEGHSNRLAPEVVDRVWNIAHRLGFGDIFRRQVGYTMNDDHIPLNEAGIPTIDVIDFEDYPYWHTPQDTPDKVSAASLEVVGTVMARLIYRGR